MRLLEVAILLTLLIAVLGQLLPQRLRPGALRYLPWLGASLIALHLTQEGYRWQMVPAYVLTGGFLLASLRSRNMYGPRTPPVSFWRGAGNVLGTAILLLLFVVAASLPALMPVFDLPDPTGPLAVGTTNISLVDRSRPETFTSDQSDWRDLPVQIWYPATPAEDSSPEPLRSENSPIDRTMPAGKGLWKLPFLFDHLALVKTHSYRDVQLSNTQPRYPVLIFSHGYWGSVAQNTVQMEELASHGYIVFSVGHPYESVELRYPDGRTVKPDKAFVQHVEDYGRKPDYGALLWKLLASEDPEERAQLLQENNVRDEHFSKSLEIWSADIRFLLDQLWKPSTGALGRLMGRLDLTRVGVFGMSFGGATATDVCIRDSRCRAGINMDGVSFGAATSVDSALTVPFMFMASEPFGLLSDPIFRRARAPAWLLRVIGSTHLGYTDICLFSPLVRVFKLTGSIRGERMEQIMNAYIRAFFDQSLLGKHSTLLDAPSAAYPEVMLQVRADANYPPVGMERDSGTTQ